MTLWLVRHATPLVEPGVCYGALDVAADAHATNEAAQALALELPTGIAVWVSPLQRCQQLAQALRCLRPDLHFQTDARLTEMNFGTWEGVAWSQIPKDAVDAWTQAFGTHRFGGQESANAVLARVALAWDAAHLSMLPDGHVVWVTHAGVIRATTLISNNVREVGRADQWPADAPAFGQWTTIV
jgi:alpha-ribazole phosphatase